MEFINIFVYASIYLGLVATTFFVLSYISDLKKKKLLFTDKELLSISIIIAAYNEEKSIEATIKSALDSDYPKDKFELLVIDDGSTDKTLELAKKFEKEGVRVFSKENGGKGSALNFGIKKAGGEIIFSMDADTFVDPKSAKNMVRYFKDERVVSVAPTLSIYNPRGFLQRIQHIEYLSGIFLRIVVSKYILFVLLDSNDFLICVVLYLPIIHILNYFLNCKLCNTICCRTSWYIRCRNSWNIKW